MSPETNMDSEALKTAYVEVCRSYERIDDFRAKLLGFLPFVSGAGFFFLLGKADTGLGNGGQAELLIPAGIFGFVVTVGLVFYELRGIQRCIRLANVGDALESRMKLEGRFRQWPLSVRRFINEPIADAFIYSGVLSAWTFLAILPASFLVAIALAGGVLGVSFAAIWRFYLDIRQREEAWKEKHGDLWLAGRPSPRE